MPRKPIEFSLDFMIKDIFSRFTVKQFDDVSFNITPMNQNKPYDTTNMRGKIFVGVNNDMFMQDTNITVSSNNINVLLDKNMLQKQGRAYAEIELTDENGTITSSSFVFDIEPKIGEGATIPGEYEGFVAKYERLISEFKTQVNNAIIDSNNRTNNTIAIFNSNANNTLNLVKNNSDNTISNFNTNSSNALNIFNINSNNKLNDVEKRFQKLTTTQQQSAEVIDARDNEISLKARLDRDLAKGKSINENVEGNYITVSDSIRGSISDIEILGNTIQDVDLNNIQSVGTLREDGLYKMSILSCSKNLFNITNHSLLESKNGIVTITSTDKQSITYKLKPKTSYTLSFSKYGSNSCWVAVDVNNTYTNNNNTDFKKTYVTGENGLLNISLSANASGNAGSTIYNIQLEEGTVATTYEKPQYNKSSILLPCQLEKVGDVSDRLFRREDGVWCVEKNIEKIKFTGEETWNTFGSDSNYSYAYTSISKYKSLEVKYFMAKLPILHLRHDGTTIPRYRHLVTHDLGIHYITPKVNTKEEFIQDLKSQNITLYYVLSTPQIIELPLDTQIQLNSFNGVTNIFTEDTIIEPTIKCTIPKSLGASVNSLVNKTDNLRQRVENVEKLKEGSELEVTTDKGYVVCENTSNGQIEDLKIEGNTLVNLCPPITQRYNDCNLSSEKGFTVIASIQGFTGSLMLRGSNSEGIAQYINVISGEGYVVKYFSYQSHKTISRVYFDNVAPSDFSKIKVMIIEGDHTQNPPNYFEGLKSVGDGVDKLEVLSRNYNPNPIPMELGTIEVDGTNTSVINRMRSISFIEVKNIYDTCLKNIDFNIYDVFYRFYDSNKKVVQVTSWLTSNVEIPQNCKYFRFGLRKRTNETITSDEVNSQKIYRYSLENKKQILYQTKEGNYEKPILRSTGTVSDSIEKHSDGKYYFHKRCGEVVLDGSSDEGWSLNNNSKVSTMTYKCENSTYNFKSYATSIVADIKCNTLNPITAQACYNGELEGISINSVPRVEVNILKSKLTTSQDVSGFKTWLSQNNVTVVYQLATEEVYEVVNLDLNSFEGETSIILDGGAISPKISFKIASHIANTVQVLKDRINYLEDKVISMFKSVLAGNMQTLAFELYPEDFKEEDIEETETIEGTELL